MNPITKAPNKISRHLAKKKTQRKRINLRRENQVKNLYPHGRTFVLTGGELIGHRESPPAHIKLPQTITLVTPDHSDFSKDHWFLGSTPILQKNVTYQPEFEEIDLKGHDGKNEIRANFRLTGSRTLASGIIEFDGYSFVASYEIKPQEYLINIAPNAAYLAGSSLSVDIKWDEQSDR